MLAMHRVVGPSRGRPQSICEVQGRPHRAYPAAEEAPDHSSERQQSKRPEGFSCYAPRGDARRQGDQRIKAQEELDRCRPRKAGPEEEKQKPQERQCLCGLPGPMDSLVGQCAPSMLVRSSPARQLRCSKCPASSDGSLAYPHLRHIPLGRPKLVSNMADLRTPEAPVTPRRQVRRVGVGSHWANAPSDGPKPDLPGRSIARRQAQTGRSSISMRPGSSHISRPDSVRSEPKSAQLCTNRR